MLGVVLGVDVRERMLGGGFLATEKRGSRRCDGNSDEAGRGGGDDTYIAGGRRNRIGARASRSNAHCSGGDQSGRRSGRADYVDGRRARLDNGEEVIDDRDARRRGDLPGNGVPSGFQGVRCHGLAGELEAALVDACDGDRIALARGGEGAGFGEDDDGGHRVRLARDGGGQGAVGC